MKKVLFLSKSEMFGGLEKVMVNIANELDKSKFSVTVITSKNNDEVRSKLNKDVKYDFLFKKRFRGLDRVLINFSPYMLHKIFIRKHYDIEIAFQEGYPTKLVLGANKKTKKLMWLHNDPYYYDFNLPFYKSKGNLKKNLEKFDKIIAVSNYIKRNYQNYISLDNEIEVIYNYIDYEEILNKSREYLVNENNKNEKFIICYVGRLSEEKQVDILIRTTISLYKKYPNIMLNIIGSGYQEKYLKELVYKNGAEQYIRFLGYKENPYPYIKNSSVLVCASKAESFCMVIGEAISLGIPVVSTKCGGPEEILDYGKYGIIVKNNINDLYKGIESILVDKEKYNKYKNIDKSYFKRFEKSKIIEEIEYMLEEL